MYIPIKSYSFRNNCIRLKFRLYSLKQLIYRYKQPFFKAYIIPIVELEEELGALYVPIAIITFLNSEAISIFSTIIVIIAF
jgi:hypothetical protein